MKNISTNFKFKAIAFFIMLKVVVFTIVLCLISSSKTVGQNSVSGDKSFFFKENGSEWRVEFEKDEIAAIYKDGARLPDNKIDEYKEMIFDKIDELKSEQDKFSGNIYNFKFDADQFKKQMKKFKEDFNKDKFMRFKLEFDEDDFNKNMEELEDKLNDLKDKKFELYFDSKKFEENMKELEEALKHLPNPPISPNIDLDIHLNMEKLKENMKKFGKEFKLHNFRIDSSVIDMKELRESMRELKRNMNGLRVEIHDLDGDMKKLNKFLADLKTELVKDGYISSIDEKFDLEMGPDKTTINEIPVKQADHNKYKKIYKRYFNKEIDGTFKIKKD
jgi:chromosome segregation ATPase